MSNFKVLPECILFHPKISDISPLVAIDEGYAMAKHGKVPTLVAYDSGNLLSVATALHQRYPDKAIIIAGDDDHRAEKIPS
jgi:putative DNA primase/helicase